MSRAIKKFLEDQSLNYIVVANLDGTIWEEFGAVDSLEHQGVVNGYIRDKSCVGDISDWLKDAILPQIVGQGKVVGLFSRISEDVVFAIFYHDESEVVEGYDRACLLEQEFMKKWIKHKSKRAKPT